MSRVKSDKESEQYSYEDFIRIPTISHRLMGYILYPPKRRLLEHLLTFYRRFCNFCHILSMIKMFYTIFNGTSIDSVPKIINYSTMVTFAIIADVKYLTSLHYKDIKRLSDKLAAMYPKTAQARIEYQVKKFYWPRSLIIVIVVYFISSATVLVGPFFQSVLIYVVSPDAEFPYLHYYPFLNIDSQNHSTWSNIGIYLLEWCHASHMLVSYMATDLWLVCFQIQICLHFSYLNRSLENFEPHEDHDLEDRQFLENLVIKHNTLIELEKDLNRIYGGSLLFTLVSVASLFCSVAVNIEIQGLTLEGVSLLMFIGTAVSQLYLTCYYGQLVNTLSTNIAYAAYSLNWLNASLSCKKHLQFIAMRGQQPVELSAMGYLPISLETFKQLMTLSYRFFALLHQMIK